MSDERTESGIKRQKLDDLGKSVNVDSSLQQSKSYEDSGIKLTTVETLPDSENVDCVSLSSILHSVRYTFQQLLNLLKVDTI